MCPTMVQKKSVQINGICHDCQNKGSTKEANWWCSQKVQQVDSRSTPESRWWAEEVCATKSKRVKGRQNASALFPHAQMEKSYTWVCARSKSNQCWLGKITPLFILERKTSFRWTYHHESQLFKKIATLKGSSRENQTQKCNQVIAVMVAQEKV